MVTPVSRPQLRRRRRCRLAVSTPATWEAAINTLEDVRAASVEFSDARDWGQFHSPKNLAMALSVEAAELLEHFQWLTQAQSDDLPAQQASEVADEIADVLIYLVLLADRLGIDLLEAAAHKMEKNAARYPVAESRGSALKYNRRQTPTS